MTTVAEKYLQIAKLAKDPANAEVVIDGILTFSDWIILTWIWVLSTCILPR